MIRLNTVSKHYYSPVAVLSTQLLSLVAVDAVDVGNQVPILPLPDTRIPEECAGKSDCVDHWYQ